MQQIYRRTIMQKCDFNKVAKQFWISNVTQHEIKITKASVFRLPLKYRKKKKNIHHENNNFIDKATAHDYFLDRFW